MLKLIGFPRGGTAASTGVDTYMREHDDADQSSEEIASRETTTMIRKAEAGPSRTEADYNEEASSLTPPSNGKAHSGHGGLLLDDSSVRPASKTKCGVVALSYMGCAVCLIVFNKAALTGFHFPYPNVITLLQLICATSILGVFTHFGVISLMSEQSASSSKKTRFVPLRMIWTSLPLSMAYLLYMVLGMYSIRGVNLPMYTTLRRTTVAFTMAVEYFTIGKLHPPKVLMSVGSIVLGAVVAGLNDFSFDAYGYGMVFASNASTALYLNTIARLGKKTPLNSFGMMWCNGLVCGPILLVICLYNNELTGAAQFEELWNPSFLIILLGSCTLAFALNYTIFLNTSINSALTQNVCGNLKDGVVIGIGFMSTMDNVVLDMYNVCGIVLGLGGSVMYAYVKLTGMK